MLMERADFGSGVKQNWVSASPPDFQVTSSNFLNFSDCQFSHLLERINTTYLAQRWVQQEEIRSQNSVSGTKEALPYITISLSHPISHAKSTLS
jgi:hypothetical protein